MSPDIKDSIIPFFIGGCVVAGVKYASQHVKNPAVAAIIGGIPTGLISIYFISDSKALKYAYNYFFVTLSLLLSIVMFYTIYKYTNLSKLFVLCISIILWAVLLAIRYILSDKDST